MKNHKKNYNLLYLNLLYSKVICKILLIHLKVELSSFKVMWEPTIKKGRSKAECNVKNQFDKFNF